MLPDRLGYSSFSECPELVLVEMSIPCKVVRVARIVEERMGECSVLPVEGIAIPVISSAK